MRQLSVSWVDPKTTKREYAETMFTLSAAKKLMKEKIREGMTDVIGSITKVWSNGDWEPAGQIQLQGSNKTFMANTRQKSASYA